MSPSIVPAQHRFSVSNFSYSVWQQRQWKWHWTENQEAWILVLTFMVASCWESYLIFYWTCFINHTMRDLT